MGKIDNIVVRMYKLGTGDCFVLKFQEGSRSKFTMMIDCGTWHGNKEHVTEAVTHLKMYVDGHINLLVVTHEHKDHVNGFDICKTLFTESFEIDKTWLAWTENEKSKTVRKWQKDYGQKKRALGLASNLLTKAMKEATFEQQFRNERNGIAMRSARLSFAEKVMEFTDLHFGAVNGDYVGGLAGMKIVKEKIAKDKVEYPLPGTIIENMDNLDGIKIYVLGPPRLWDELKKETGRKEESYDHNKHLSECNTFAEAIFNKTTDSSVNISPFDDVYITEESVFTDKYYKGNEWRRVDHDWLYSAGSMALRINSITNNLSLALAIEFEESGRVLLFPGDAEYGNWASWHKLDWGIPGRNKDKHLTEDLLNRTVFYKVAHHLSHNGTAKHLGLEMMNHPDLVAMATLDYDAISPIWKGTMPNRAIVQDLLSKCKGRLLIMNEENLFYDEKNKEKLSEKIKQARTRMNVKENFAFKQALTIEPIYIDFIVKAGK